jgi:hypothetical protein
MAVHPTWPARLILEACKIIASLVRPVTPEVRQASYEHDVVLPKMQARVHAEESEARVRYW